MSFSSVSTQKHAINLLFLIIHAHIYILCDLAWKFTDLQISISVLCITLVKTSFPSYKLTVLAWIRAARFLGLLGA